MRINLMAFGDTHGLEDIAYAMTRDWERRNKRRVHAVFLPGDLDTIIHKEAPDAIRSMVADYYYGTKKAPYMTFFVAGNMDEWGILRRFPGGGSIAQNMFFLGRSGYTDFMGIRIAGLSGVYNKGDYEEPLPKEPSFIPWQHYRKNEVDNLKGLNPDIILLHERVAPDEGKYIRRENGNLWRLSERKNTPLSDVVSYVQPKYVFMGHEHDVYLEGRTGKTQLYGLRRVTEKSDLRSRYCYKVVSIKTTI